MFTGDKMSRFEVFPILVEPQKNMNLGMIARTAYNFDIKELRIVGESIPVDEVAIKFSKRGRWLLQRFKHYPDLKSAISDMDLVLGFTGVPKRFGSVKYVLSANNLSEFLKNTSFKKIGAVFGRESIGLKAEEVELCDATVFINTGGDPVLNLAQAFAIGMYALSGNKPNNKLKRDLLNKGEKEHLKQMFKRLVNKYKSGLRQPSKTVSAFSRLLGRSDIGEKEGRLILNLFKVILEREKDEE